MGEVRRRRPWLAVLLALVISGLGHAYLRRWGRALGWYVAITATVVFLVPDSAIDGMFAGTPPPIADVLPALVVVVASVADAYVLAVRNNRRYDRQAGAKTSGSGDVEPTALERNDTDDARDGTAAVGTGGSADRIDPEASSPEATPPTDCPHCGRETDPELDFCHWCTEPLPGSGEPSKN